MDLELLRLTNKENPSRYTVNKRKDSWSLIATDMTTLFDGEIFDDRRCRERVKVLMKARPVEADKKITGAGKLSLTEADNILNTSIQEEDFTANNASAEMEKEEQSKQLTLAIQKHAMTTTKKRTNLDDDVQTVPEIDVGSSGTKKSSLKVTAPFKKRKVEPVHDYLEAKKAQQVKELDIRLEMHRETMLDNAAERSIRPEQLEFERERLRMENADKARGFELKRDEQERRFQLEKKNEIQSYLRDVTVQTLDFYLQ